MRRAYYAPDCRQLLMPLWYCQIKWQKKSPEQKMQQYSFFAPLLLSVLILHETMTPLQILGAFLIIGGAVFGECYTGRKQP